MVYGRLYLETKEMSCFDTFFSGKFQWEDVQSFWVWKKQAYTQTVFRKKLVKKYEAT